VQKKAPAIFTADEHLQPFGLRVRDLVRSPLGVTGVVVGVRYPSTERAEAKQGMQPI
jgi:hypothetical protein